MCATGSARRKPAGLQLLPGPRAALGWRRARRGVLLTWTSTASDFQQLADKVRPAAESDRAEALRLYREAPTMLLGWLADGIRARKHPSRTVTYIIDRNVNYTNLCVGALQLLRVLPHGRIAGRLRARLRGDPGEDPGDDRPGRQPAAAAGRPQPDLPIQWYEDLFRHDQGEVSGLQAARAVAARGAAHLAAQRHLHQGR
jgi:hypothetical protein